MSLLVPAYPGCPGSKAVKRSLLLLLLLLFIYPHDNQVFHSGILELEGTWWCIRIEFAAERRRPAVNQNYGAFDNDLTYQWSTG